MGSVGASYIRSVVVILGIVLATFAIFHLAVFPVFRDIADLGPDHDNIGQVRTAFLGLFVGLVGGAILSGALAGRVMSTPWTIVFAVVAPTVLLLAFFSLYLLDFMNACEVGASLVVDARC